MTRQLRELERVEHRVLGALEFVDATSGSRIREALSLQALGGARPVFVRNRSGLHVLWELPALAAHAEAFAQAPDLPALGSLELQLTVSDPAGRYQARGFSMHLPRDADAANAGDADSVFRPQRVPLTRGAAAPVEANWARLEVRVVELSSGDVLGGTLIEVRDAALRLLASALTDWRGEAVVPVAGVPVTTWSDDPHAVVVSEIAATVHATHVAALGTRTPAARVDAGLPPDRLPCPDPDTLTTHAQRRTATPQLVNVAARRAVRVPTLSIDLS